MLNNLSNIFNLKKGRKFKTTAESKDVLLLGTKDSKYGGEYKPTAILFEDLEAQIVASVPVPPPSDNTWDMTGVAFVDPVNGNNTTATLSDGNLPYQTVAAAAAASDFVYLLPGTYTETITLATNKTYYCYKGVKFTTGGLYSLNTVIDNVKFLGYAVFTTSANINVRPTSMNNSVFEFESFTSGGSGGVFFEPVNYSKTHIHFKTIDINVTNAGAPPVNFRGALSGNLIIDYCAGYYKVLNLRGNKYDLNVEVGYLLIRDGGLYGNTNTFKCGIVFEEAGVGFDFRMNVTVGTLIDETSASLSISGAIQGINLHVGVTFNVKVGYAKTLVNPILYMNLVSGYVIAEVNGGISNGGEVFYVIASNSITIKNSTFSQAITSYLSNSTVYVQHSSIFDSGLNDTITGAGVTSHLYMENVGLQGSGLFNLYTGAGSTYGFNSVISTHAVDGATTNVYTLAGYVIDAQYQSPKIN